MYNKNMKTVTTFTASRQQITTTSKTSVTSSRTQMKSVGYESPYRSSTTSNRAVTNINSPASATSQYQPVYNQSSRTDANDNFSRYSPVYHSLQSTPSSLTRTALTSTGERLLSSFGTNRENNRSMPMVNSEQAMASTSSSWKAAPSSSSNTISNVSQDARPFGNIHISSVGRPSNTASVQKYDLKDNAYVLIFHHLFKNDATLHRKGSEQDLKLIKKFFRNYRAKVVDPCEDYTVKKIKRKMDKIRTKKFNNYSCLIIIIMSHGGTKDHIRAYDEMFNFEMEVVEPVLMNSSLKDKPKLFFVQACKGDALMETDTHPKATNKFDIFKCFSTYEGTVSWRDITGTYFIQTLFQSIEENADKEITEIMRLMRNKFACARVQQAPTDTSTLTKQLFFSDLRKHN